MALSRSFDKKYETDALGWCAFCSSDMSDESVVKLIGGNDSSSNCVSEAARMLSGDDDGAIRAADDGTLMMEGVFGAEINDEPRVP